MKNFFDIEISLSRRNAFLVAISLVAIATILRIWPLQQLGINVPYITFYPAIIFAAIIGGFFIGMFTAFLSCLSIIFIWPLYLDGPVIKTVQEWIVTGIFLIISTLISFLAENTRRANERAKREQKLLEFALNAAKQGYWNLNLKSMEVETRTLLHDEIFGYPNGLAKWSYKMFLNQVHPEDRELVDTEFHKALANKQTWCYQFRIIRADNQTIHWVAVFGEQYLVGKTKHMLGLIEDITERKKSEDATAMLSALVEFSDEAIIGKDLNGIIFSWNKAAEELYGYTEAEAVGSSIEILFPPDSSDELKNIMELITEDEHIKHKETIRKHKDGHLIPVSITISPIKNAHGDVIGASTTARDISKQKQMEEKLRHLAEHDPLTGLVNRPLFEDRIEQGAAFTRREKSSMAVCFIDLDDFKQINDNYNHQIGDLLLQAATQRMQHCIRNMDTLARLGGDEFGLILISIRKKQDAAIIAEKLIQSFANPFLIDNKTLSVSLSIGIAFYPKEEEKMLIEKADAAMYQAKKLGKNRYKIYEDTDR